MTNPIGGLGLPWRDTRASNPRRLWRWEGHPLLLWPSWQGTAALEVQLGQWFCGRHECRAGVGWVMSMVAVKYAVDAATFFPDSVMVVQSHRLCKIQIHACWTSVHKISRAARENVGNSSNALNKF
mmetsp:Transcript_73811/g.142741  ORF Transcript_73811/g.142741 Transcript_73811/m.142741 type:complete len:126 (-) Transcript_73811:10-387(-)